MVRVKGIGPLTSTLSEWRSTTELHAHLLNFLIQLHQILAKKENIVKYYSQTVLTPEIKPGSIFA